MKKVHVLIFFAASFSVAVSSSKKILNYDAIFNFGDSLSDTGNLLLSSRSDIPVIGKLPYGQTYFKRPTGRCSDGRLIIDFIAEASGLPFLPPYLGLEGQNQIHNLRKGVNFAVAGATALDPKFFRERKFKLRLLTNNSLNVQIGWFKKLKPSLCTTKQDCDKYFKKSLFFVGEIGGNDFNYPLFSGVNFKQMRGLVPFVIQEIVNAAGKLIEEGAKTLVLPGNFPGGCNAGFLTVFASHDESAYDKRNGCLKAPNNFATFYNNKLKEGIEILRKRYPYAKIIYADYYGAALRFYNAPLEFGFKGGDLRACCGGGGPFNFNSTAQCGHKGSTVCADPLMHPNWDGVHLTEAAHSRIASALLNGFTTPPLVDPSSI